MSALSFLAVNHKVKSGYWRTTDAYLRTLISHHRYFMFWKKQTSFSSSQSINFPFVYFFCGKGSIGFHSRYTINCFTQTRCQKGVFVLPLKTAIKMCRRHFVQKCRYKFIKASRYNTDQSNKIPKFIIVCPKYYI